MFCGEEDLLRGGINRTIDCCMKCQRSDATYALLGVMHADENANLAQQMPETFLEMCDVQHTFGASETNQLHPLYACTLVAYAVAEILSAAANVNEARTRPVAFAPLDKVSSGIFRRCISAKV